jgi:S-adenosylmethionine:tRNA ribosyltransferase-isomerase
MRVDAFDFTLPEELIALRPAEPRDSARLLHVRPGGAPELDDRRVRDFPDLLRPGDVLVFNDTRVIPARLAGRRIGRGEGAPRVEITLHKRVEPVLWWAFARPARKLASGDRIAFDGPDGPEQLWADIEEKGTEGEVLVRFDCAPDSFEARLAAVGQTPLPPYIASRRNADEQDVRDYQTIFAREGGAVAAPTAGLHFTPELLNRLRARDVEMHTLTLHVGAGTFLPVKAETTQEHRMHSERGVLTPDVAARLRAAREEGRRIVSIGTTPLRLLEAAALETGRIEAYDGDTDIFITPGFRFKAVDMLWTNFHLPRSTLFMLVSAFSGLDLMRRAYAHAIAEGYRFYSYGDASLLERAS